MFLVRGTPSSHTVVHKHANVNTVTYGKVGTDFWAVFSLHNPLEHGIYSYELFLSFTGRTEYNISMYGECGAPGYNATTLNWLKSVADKAGATLGEKITYKMVTFVDVLERSVRCMDRLDILETKLLTVG